MEDGMKTVPASVGVKERWIAISKLVDNKNPKECYERFRVLCAKMKAAKEAGAAKSASAGANKDDQSEFFS
jgi:hypothetical protein